MSDIAGIAAARPNAELHPHIGGCSGRGSMSVVAGRNGPSLSGPVSSR